MDPVRILTDEQQKREATVSAFIEETLATNPTFTRPTFIHWWTPKAEILVAGLNDAAMWAARFGSAMQPREGMTLDRKGNATAVYLTDDYTDLPDVSVRGLESLTNADPSTVRIDPRAAVAK